MLKRVFFVRPLIVSVFFLLFVDVMATEDEKDPERAAKQNFLRENILEKEGYDTNAFVGFLAEKREGGDDVDNWTMEELKKVVNEFDQQEQKQALLRENIQTERKEAFQEFLKSKKKEVNATDIDNWTMEELIVVVKEFKKKNSKKNALKNLEVNKQDFSSQNQNELGSNYRRYSVDSIHSNHAQLGKKGSQDQNYFYELSENKNAIGVFDFYRYGGKILTSLVWSVVNSYCGFEEIVMNDWYCFKYTMCSGYRLQPRFMGSRVWIDMNVNFLEGIAGFLIRFFLFESSYNMYENIFDLFNVCIDIKVYNNLYLAVNVVGIVRSIVLLSILCSSMVSPSRIKNRRS